MADQFNNDLPSYFHGASLDEREAGRRILEVIGDHQNHMIKTTPEAWPDPKPVETRLPAVKQFDPDLLPDYLRDYVMDVADRQQSPPDFVAVAAMCGVAAVAGNDVRIRPKANDDWEVVPNLWGAIIGRPSAMKSPAQRAALSPVFALENHARKDWETAKREREIDAAINDIDAKGAAKEAAKAIRAGDKERARTLFAKHMEHEEEAAYCPRLIVNDAFVEKLGELLNQNRHGLLLSRDELAGFLTRLEAEEFQGERAFYLEGFNGDGSFTFDRIGRGTIRIERATISIIGGIQPSKIAPLVRGAITGATDDGLLQRFQLAVWPDDLKIWEWKDRRPDARAFIAYDAAFQAVHIYCRNLVTPAIYNFDPEAQNLFRQWMIEIQTEARAGKLATVHESHLLKLPKTIASLALLFELIEGGREKVGPISTGRALDWADYLRTHAARLYSAGSVMAENGARRIIERRDQIPEKFTLRDVQRKGWAGLTDHYILTDVIDLLVEAHQVRGSTVQSTATGGRPTVLYEWNPKLGRGG